MPFPDVTGWGGPQQYDYGAQPPQHVLDALGGAYDPARYSWNPDTYSLVDRTTGQSYSYDRADPANGTNVYYDGQTQNFAQGETPFFGFGDGQQTFISSDPNAIDEWQHDRQTRSLQGIASVGAIVGGAALGGALGGGGAASGSAGYGGAATTYPLASGGAIGVSPLAGAGGAAGAAGAAAGGSGAAAAGAAATGASRWLPYAASGVNALLGYSAADDAADAESAAYQAAIEEQRRQYDTTRSDLMPWMDTGRGALNRLNDPAASYAASPGYEWARTEGQRDIGNHFAARGSAQSGNAMRALAEFQTGLAQQDYGNWWNQQAGLAGVGQTATNTAANVGQNTAANVGNFMANQGASRASGVIGRRAALAGGLNEGVTNWLYNRRVA
jgi:hypothetical protein